ncbi:MAG: hypothetical protein ACM31F_01325 [Gemmatimonas sp.]
MRRVVRTEVMIRAIAKIRKASFALTLPVVAACLSVDVPEPFAPLTPGGHQILFIGNSLTYTNDLPGTVVDLAKSAGDTIRAASVALPNFAVIDHALGLSNAVDVIKAQKWEMVLLQQGPTTTLVNRDTLIIATRALDPYVKAAGGKTAQLMTWPASSSPELFPLVRASSQAAASSVSGGIFIPAGDAWRAALEAQPDVMLYGSDGYHPGPLGTYLAALVIYEKVTGHDARLLSGVARVGGATLSVPETTVRFLQRVAHETVARYE